MTKTKSKHSATHILNKHTTDGQTKPNQPKSKRQIEPVACSIMCVAECFDFMFVICMFRFCVWMVGFVMLCLDLLICDFMFLCVGVLISLSYLFVMM